MFIPDYEISTFYGLNTSVKDIKTLKKGVSPDALNWLTTKFGDAIELRRGHARIGQTDNMGNGRVTGIGVATRYDGTQVLLFSHGRKVKYYDADADEMVEVGSDLLPAAADGEDVWIEQYQNLAGSFAFVGSPNSGIYKIPAANPGSAVDQSVENHRFNVFHIGQNRSFAGQRNGTVAGNKDDTGLYLSYIDKDQLSDYTQHTGENVGTGDGGTKTFADTLAQVTGANTAMYVSVTDGTETFQDDRNGGLVGDLGGTGTINYATGAVSVTFATAPSNAQAITASYYVEDATSNGILDYSGSANGQGKSFRQDDGGGKLMSVFNLSTVEYCFHQLRTWQFTATLDDTNSTNLPYRNVGIPYERAAWQTPDGIIFADYSRATEPKFRKMQVLQNTNIETIEPLSISDELDLSPYGFGKCVAYRWGDFEIFCVQRKVLGVAEAHNSIMFVHNVVSNTWDRLSYYASSLTEFNGTLVAGDSISNNAYTLFSGYDEDGGLIENYWTSSDLNLGTENMKKCRRMEIAGLIQPDQELKISISYDGGQFTEVFTVDGRGAYVDTGIETYIGGPTVGSTVIGGGGQTTASPYEVDFKLNSDRFIHARVKVEAVGIGYLSVNSIKFKDIRDKGRKNLRQRTQ